MIVVLDGGTLSLAEGHEFSRFSLLCRNVDRAQRGIDPSGIEFTDDDHAWIPVATVIALQGHEATETWRRQLHAMIEKARAYGWVDEANERIRAHVE